MTASGRAAACHWRHTRIERDHRGAVGGHHPGRGVFASRRCDVSTRRPTARNPSIEISLLRKLSIDPWPSKPKFAHIIPPIKVVEVRFPIRDRARKVGTALPLAVPRE